MVVVEVLVTFAVTSTEAAVDSHPLAYTFTVLVTEPVPDEDKVALEKVTDTVVFPLEEGLRVTSLPLPTRAIYVVAES